MNKEVIERQEILQHINLDDEPDEKGMIKKKKQPNKKKKYENHSQLNSYKSTQTNYLPLYLSITNNLLG